MCHHRNSNKIKQVNNNRATVRSCWGIKKKKSLSNKHNELKNFFAQLVHICHLLESKRVFEIKFFNFILFSLLLHSSSLSTSANNETNGFFSSYCSNKIKDTLCIIHKFIYIYFTSQQPRDNVDFFEGLI